MLCLLFVLVLRDFRDRSVMWLPCLKMETYWLEARAIFFFKKIYSSIVKFNSL